MDKPQILIVDDIQENLFALEKLLKRLDVNIVKAVSGNEALAYTLDYNFALIILDVQMPVMDGYEVAEFLKGEEKTASIPIIFITAIDQSGDHEIRGYSKGAVDYIFKPFNEFVLLSKVNVFLELYRMKCCLEDKVAARTAEIVEKNADLEQKIIEIESAKQELAESEEKYRNLFKSAPDGIIITTIDGEILSINEAYCHIFSIPSYEKAGLHTEKSNVMRFYNNPEDRKKMLLALMQEKQLENYEINLKDACDRVFPASLSMSLIRYEGKTCIQTIIRDISNIKKMEAELRDYAENLQQMVDEKTQELLAANTKLSATIDTLETTREQLAASARQAGMAEIAVSVLHNIGNAVTPVNVRIGKLEDLSFASEIETLQHICNLIQNPEKIGQNKEKIIALFSATLDIIKNTCSLMKSDFEFIRKGTNHIMEIIALQQKYALHRAETLVSVNDLLQDAADMLADSMKCRNINIYFDLGNIPDSYIDRNRMIQIFINILRNAYESIDAMTAVNEKHIRIKTEFENCQSSGQDYIKIIVIDSGAGFPSDIKSEMFKYGFSTKGRGTGFGLHDSANYIRAQGGSIDIQSDGTGKGARVIIQLPVIKE